MSLSFPIMTQEALNATQCPCCSFSAIYINPIKMTPRLIQMLHTNWTKGWGDIEVHMERLISVESVWIINFFFFFLWSRFWLCLNQSACWNVSFWLAAVVVFILGNICSLTGLITWAVAVFSLAWWWISSIRFCFIRTNAHAKAEHARYSC